MSTDQDPVARLRAAGCVYAEEEARLLIAAASTPVDLAAMVDQRAGGLPLEQVLGWADFCGLRIDLEPGVFVPRRRTELLVEQAAALAREAAGRPARASATTVVVDLCCGSGAVGAALVAALGHGRASRELASRREDGWVGTAGHGRASRELASRREDGWVGTAGQGGLELHAVDIDPVAVRCARRNLAAGGARVYQGDLYEPLPAALQGRVDVLLANAPYVPTGAIGLLPPEARIHEPRVALDGGADGLDILRRVVDGAPAWLAPGGCLLVECSDRQAGQIAAAIDLQGLIPRVVRSDGADATVVIGVRRRSSAGTASPPSVARCLPSTAVDATNPHLAAPAMVAGCPLDDADVVGLLLHGRGGRPEDMLDLAEQLAVPSAAWVAPRADARSWYPRSFLAPLDANEPRLSFSLDLIRHHLDRLERAGWPARHVALIGFSQGGCIALEAVARAPQRLGAVVALTAGLIGPYDATLTAPVDGLAGTPMLLTTATHDSWVPASRTRRSAAVMEAAGAEVDLRIYAGDDHRVRPDESAGVRELVLGAARARSLVLQDAAAPAAPLR